MLGEFDLLFCYPFFNLIITLCAIAIISNINGDKLNSTQLYLKIFLLLIIPFLVWYITGLYLELCPALLALLASLCDIRITMGGNGSTKIYKITPQGSTGGCGVGNYAYGQSRPQASSSGDNTVVSPQVIQQALPGVSLEMSELLSDLAILSNAINSQTILSHLNLPDHIKSELAE